MFYLMKIDYKISHSTLRGGKLARYFLDQCPWYIKKLGSRDLAFRSSLNSLHYSDSLEWKQARVV